MGKRIGLFILTNIAVIAMVSIVLNLLGVNGYISQYGIEYKSLMIFCLVWGMAGSFISLMLSKFMAKMMMGVKIIDKNDHQFGAIVSTVHRLATSAGLSKMPEVGVYDSPEVNAFATGPSKRNSLVAVSTGLLSRMNSDEVEGVLAHEIAHIANGDMVTMTLVQGVINAFVMFFARIAAFALQNAMRGNNDRDDRGSSFGGGLVYMITVFVFEIIFGILGSIIVAFFSRYREFRADAGGAKLAGRDKMIAALASLQRQFDSSPIEDTPAMNAMKISSKPNGIRALFSTHPPLEERIKALQRAI